MLSRMQFGSDRKSGGGEPRLPGALLSLGGLHHPPSWGFDDGSRNLGHRLLADGLPLVLRCV